jgi:hypothetical protein
MVPQQALPDDKWVDCGVDCYSACMCEVEVIMLTNRMDRGTGDVNLSPRDKLRLSGPAPGLTDLDSPPTPALSSP